MIFQQIVTWWLLTKLTFIDKTDEPTMKDLMVCKRTRHPISRSLNSKHDSVENKHHLIETSAIISQVSKSLDSFRLEVMGLDSKGDWQRWVSLTLLWVGIIWMQKMKSSSTWLCFGRALDVWHDSYWGQFNTNYRVKPKYFNFSFSM